MDTGIAIDNDVLIKLACYDVLKDLSTVMGKRFYVLGAAQYVARQRLLSDGRTPEAASALGELDAFLCLAAILEPTPAELTLAIEMETTAARLGVELDSGESLLAAALLVGDLDFLLTGDKRAIMALEMIATTNNSIDSLNGRTFCLEQLMITLVHAKGMQHIRTQVCKAPRADRAISICFSCSSPSHISVTDVGLRSYVDALRLEAPRILCSGYMLPHNS